MNIHKKVLSLILAISMIISLFIAQTAEFSAKEQLVNVALEATPGADGEDTTYGGLKINMNDGDDNTMWKYPASQFPARAWVEYEGSKNIQKVVVKLGGGDQKSASVDVTVMVAKNGITTELVPFGETKKNQALGSDVVFEVSEPIQASHVFVEISNPVQNGQSEEITFWPAIRELETYEMQDVKLSNYNDIAPQADITTNGDNPATSPSTLVDGDYSTLYKFHNAQLYDQRYIDLTFEDERSIDAFEIAFEHLTTETDQYDYHFTYSILGKKAGSDDFVTLVQSAKADRLDNYYQSYKIDEAQYSVIRILMEDCTSTAGKGWPAVADFKIYGSEAVIDDSESIAWKKPVHSNFGNNAQNINDGSKNTCWTGSYYPGYVDIDLEKNYYLDTVEVFTPSNGYSQYTIYTSLDGRDFLKLAEKQDKEACPAEGNIFNVTDQNVEARYIRIYFEYNSASTQSIVNEVRATGRESGTSLQEKPEINVVDYDKSVYNVEITEQDTYEEVQGIITRRLGEEYVDWFTLELGENPQGHSYDYFELSDLDGKIHIEGNDGVSLATGLNHYLKYYCKVNISQVGDQVDMPDAIVPLGETVFKETKAEVRYSYNYCTLSYSMAFWGEEEWRNELDWLALNGVNVVLDATAQEEVWRQFLMTLGYTEQEAKDYIAGPAYYAWAYMANLSGFGGPVHDTWFEERTELARKNQLSMAKLGMQPALQGYSGMVPTDIVSKAAGEYALTDSDVIAQGSWCSFTRPTMLKTTSEAFDKYAELFYQCQKNVLGDRAHYYATDPFHEGGITTGLKPAEISEEVLNSMLANDSEAVWIIQSWQGNPTSELLRGLGDRKDHALILDLYAEKTPHWNEGHEGAGSYGYAPEFDSTPWVFCMLNNFGGRLGLHGHLDNLVNNIPEAFNTADYIAGIGITPEASVNNPLLYDFLFECIWQDDATQDMEVVDIDAWLKDYAERRYGAESESALQALEILTETVYKSSLNMKGQGAPESVVNAKPALNIGAASTWGNAIVDYDKVELEKAAALLLEDYDTLNSSVGYRYDLANILQQVLSNTAQEYQKKMTSAINAGDAEKFDEISAKFLEIIDLMDRVTGTSKYFMLGNWVNPAKKLAENADDFTKDLYEFNAKALITTWGSYNQSVTGGLSDYSNRQWNGLIGDYYKGRWELWINEYSKRLHGEEANVSQFNNNYWFNYGWEWARGNTEYSDVPTDENLKLLGEEILANYSAADPNADKSKDIDPNVNITVTAGNFQTRDKPENVLDYSASTIWHTLWAGSPREEHYLEFTFDEAVEVDGFRYLPRASGVNGVATSYELYAMEEGSDEYVLVSSGELDSSNRDWQVFSFERMNAVKMKFVVRDALSDTNGKIFASVAELHFTDSKLGGRTKGDVNNDGRVTIDDATLVQQYLSHIKELDEESKTIADMNGDGKVTVYDVTLIQILLL